MRIAQLSAWIIRLPLKRPFRHASHERTESRNLLVRCCLEDGTEGWGEGVPRDYVTGETAESAMDMFTKTNWQSQLGRRCDNWQSVIGLCDSIRPTIHGEDPRGCRSNSLRCAVELSILDAFGKVLNEPISRVIEHLNEAKSIRTKIPSIRYSTTITAETAKRERISAIKMRLYGFAQCKVKVGVAGQDDAARLRRLRRWLGRRVDIRLDANEGWDASQVLEQIERLTPAGITCIEQPVSHAQLEQLPAIRQSTDIPIMLDESLTSEQDARRAIELGAVDLLNIRLSKCGGYLNSLRLAALAERSGLGYQLGCHPGETGVLSAAGRHWACTVKNIRYLEGSYDRHVLRTLPTYEDITFGYGGRASRLDQPGLGVTIDPQVLDSIADQQPSHADFGIHQIK